MYIPACEPNFRVSQDALVADLTCRWSLPGAKAAKTMTLRYENETTVGKTCTPLFHMDRGNYLEKCGSEKELCAYGIT